jgi:transcriptional regulator with XRE-family HTH domain
MKKPYVTKPGFGKFGARLKAERVRRQFQVNEFAHLVGISPGQVTAAENRGVTPNLWTVVAMAQVLACSVDYLVGLED